VGDWQRGTQFGLIWEDLEEYGFGMFLE